VISIKLSKLDHVDRSMGVVHTLFSFVYSSTVTSRMCHGATICRRGLIWTPRTGSTSLPSCCRVEASSTGTSLEKLQHSSVVTTARDDDGSKEGIAASGSLEVHLHATCHWLVAPIRTSDITRPGGRRSKSSQARHDLRGAVATKIMMK